MVKPTTKFAKKLGKDTLQRIKKLKDPDDIIGEILCLPLGIFIGMHPVDDWKSIPAQSVNLQKYFEEIDIDPDMAAQACSDLLSRIMAVTLKNEV